MIAGPCGLSLRVSDGLVQTQFGLEMGAYQLVMTRQLPTALPTVAWTDADLFDEGATAVYDLDDQYVCQQIEWDYQSYVVWNPAMSQSRTGDDIIEIDNTAYFTSSDFAFYGAQTQSFSIPGSFGVPTLTHPQGMSQYAAARSNEIFELFQRSATQSAADVLGTSPQADLGNLVLWESQRLPNPALNARGGARLCRVIKKTVLEEGATYLLQDIGPAAQPAETQPTFTLTGDAANPTHVVNLTVTNLGVLETTYPGGHVSVALLAQATQPGTSESGVRQLDIPIANIPTTGVIILPAQAMGSTVWVQMNARPGGGQLPSAWTAWQDVTLSAPTPISNLTATPAAGGECLLTWTNSDATTPITIYLMSAVGVVAGQYSVLLSQSSISQTVGNSVPLSAQTYNSAGILQTGPTYTWNTTNSGVATITGSGPSVTVNFVGSGSCQVTATDTAHGSAVGTTFINVQVGVGVGQVVVSPSSFQMTLTSGTTTLGVTVYNTLGGVVSSPTVTVDTSNHAVATATIAGTVITVTQVGVGTCTVIATSGGVHGDSACTVTTTFANLAQAARLSGGKRFLTTVNQNYPTDNFAVVGGQVNTALDLPYISAGYGSFTPGVADGNIWPELVDINTVMAFGPTTTAAATNNPTIAAVTTQMVVQARVLVDSIRALALNGGAGVFCIGSSPTANKKLEMYLQIGATATVQLTAAAYGTGSVRTTVTASGFIAQTTLPPPGCWVNCICAVDTSSTHTLKVWMYDDNGKLLVSNSAALSTALNTDGGANGCLFLNQAFNTNPGDGPTEAITYGGLAVCTGTVQATPAVWQPPNEFTTGLSAWYTMAYALPGNAVTSLYAQDSIGETLTVTGSAISQYDNGNPFNWGTFPNGPGGEVMDENAWDEFHVITAMTGPGAMTFDYGFTPTVTKARSLGIRSRAYLFSGAAGSAYSGYALYVTNAGTATAALQAYVTGIVGYCVATFGTASQGGIAVWNIANEAYQGGVLQASIWQPYLGAEWIADVAAMVYAIEPDLHHHGELRQCGARVADGAAERDPDGAQHDHRQGHPGDAGRGGVGVPPEQQSRVHDAGSGELRDAGAARAAERVRVVLVRVRHDRHGVSRHGQRATRRTADVDDGGVGGALQYKLPRRGVQSRVGLRLLAEESARQLAQHLAAHRVIAHGWQPRIRQPHELRLDAARRREQRTG